MERVKVDEELSSCPKCGMGGGFHLTFHRVGGASAGKLEVALMCPSCRHRFTVGDFRIPDGEPRSFDPAIDEGQ
jgi:hypothetical protein